MAYTRNVPFFCICFVIFLKFPLVPFLKKTNMTNIYTFFAFTLFLRLSFFVPFLLDMQTRAKVIMFIFPKISQRKYFKMLFLVTLHSSSGSDFTRTGLHRHTTPENGRIFIRRRKQTIEGKLSIFQIFGNFLVQRLFFKIQQFFGIFKYFQEVP